MRCVQGTTICTEGAVICMLVHHDLCTCVLLSLHGQFELCTKHYLVYRDKANSSGYLELTDVILGFIQRRCSMSPQ